MTTPESLKYTEAHTWLRAESDGTFAVGITFHAQDSLGDIVFVEVPAAGRKVKQGEQVGVVESVKAASDIYAPLSGEILESNADLADTPEKINETPYATWIFRMKSDDAAEITGLLDAAAYEKVAAADRA